MESTLNVCTELRKGIVKQHNNSKLELIIIVSVVSEWYNYILQHHNIQHNSIALMYKTHTSNALQFLLYNIIIYVTIIYITITCFNVLYKYALKYTLMFLLLWLSINIV